MKYILLMKNDKPFAMYETVQRAEKAIREIGGWNLWDIYDMSMVPAQLLKLERTGG